MGHQFFIGTDLLTRDLQPPPGHRVPRAAVGSIQELDLKASGGPSGAGHPVDYHAL